MLPRSGLILSDMLLV